MTSSLLKVSFLGLGNMGNAMANNILKKGFQLVVWSRTASKADVRKLTYYNKLKEKIFRFRS